MTHSGKALLSINNAEVRYGPVLAVDDVTIDIHKGEWLGIVGESGCGKSSLGKAIMQLEPLAHGRIAYRDVEFGASKGRPSEPLHRKMQLIFQDPYSSLNPKLSAGTIIAEPLCIHRLYKKQRQERVLELLDMVGLRPEMALRYPHEFSGGQRQRIGIARALAVEPEFLVCDEPISALDVSVQAQILNLFADLQSRLNLTYLFIAHNLPAVAMFSSRIAVMYLGQFVEIGTPAEILKKTAHPYTQSLLDAVPLPDPKVERVRRHSRPIVGEPEITDDKSGCRFRSRCWLYQEKAKPEICRSVAPELGTIGRQHLARCHFSTDVVDHS